MSSGKKIVLFVTVLAVGIGALVIATWPSDSSNSSEPKSLDALRQVVVITDAGEARSSEVVSRLCGASSNCLNGKGNVDVAMLRYGEIPDQPIRATVVTDNNCTPDIYGISHCTNRLLLADGQMIEVRHDHNMQRYPCLQPGEVVSVRGEFSA